MACLPLQKPVEAEKNLRTSVALSNQTYADAILALAVLLLGRHDSVDGEPLLRRGPELNPNSWVGYYELGKLELYRMRLEAAPDAAKTAKSLAPQQPKVYRLLSLIHLRQKNYQAALADLDAYIRLDPDSPRGAPQNRSAPTPGASWKAPIPDWNSSPSLYSGRLPWRAPFARPERLYRAGACGSS